MSSVYLYIKRFVCRYAAFLPAVILFHGSASAQEASATLDTSLVMIGKQAKLTIDLKQRKAENIQWPVITDTLGGLDVISKSTVDTVRETNPALLHRRQTLMVTAFDSGYFVIPPFTFSEEGNPITKASTNPLLLTVQIMPVDTTKTFKDIKNIAEIPFDWRDYIWQVIIALVAIAVVVAGIIIYRRIKNNRKVPFFAAPAPELPPHETALAALKELDNGKHWQSGRYKFYHSSISDIIRIYIEKRWNVPAMEQTTDEILGSIRNLDLSQEAGQKLNYILRIADLAKFAKLMPLAHENEQAMREAIGFVTMTIPAMQPVETKEVVR